MYKQKEIVNMLADKTDEDGIRNYFVEKDKLHELLLHEETYWKQRAKTFWIAEGDSNSKFFHAYASARRSLISFQDYKQRGEVLFQKRMR